MNPFIIGIAGGSGSGKTTLCELIEGRLRDKKVCAIHMDRYFKDPLPQMISPVTGETYNDWNHPNSVDHEIPLGMIKTMKEEREFDLALVEGAYLFCYDVIRPLLDLKVFIELDADLRMLRRIKRNTDNFMVRDGFKGIDFQSGYYLNFAKHREKQFALPSKVYADVILNGNKLDGPAFEMLVAYIETMINQPY